MAQIAQMDHRHTAGGEHPDGVGPPQGAFLVVVEGLDLPDLEGALPGRQQLDAVHRIVVKVMMAAVDRVGLRLQRRIPLHSGVGVRHDPVAVLFQQKTGMSQPCYAHTHFLL